MYRAVRRAVVVERLSSVVGVGVAHSSTMSGFAKGWLFLIAPPN